MNYLQKYIRGVSYGLLAGLVVLFILNRTGIIDHRLFLTIVTCKLLTSLGFISGMYLNVKGLRKGEPAFMIFVLGGMVGRIFLFLPILLFLPGVLNLNSQTFVLLFFLFYVVFLILEIIFLSKFEIRKSPNA